MPAIRLRIFWTWCFLAMDNVNTNNWTILLNSDTIVTVQTQDGTNELFRVLDEVYKTAIAYTHER